MLNNPLVTRAHFYTLLTGVCASCGNKQPGHLNGRAVLRHFVPNKGLHPLRRLRVYPSALCSGNSLLVQSISTAKPENSISSRRPSTENVGGLFASIFNRQEVKIMQEKEIEKLQAEKEKVERQLAQEQHKIQRLENRAAYYEKRRSAQAGAPAHHPWRSHRECRTADERVGRNRVLRPCRTGLCSARCAKASHGSCQQLCRR